jgi:signal transduction histidine kinase
VEVPAAPELAALAATLNDLLERVNAASEQQRRFIGDAAHELRTPVATLLASAELHERTSSDPEAGDMARQAERLAVLVTDLLVLARLDTHGRADSGPVDLAAIIRDELASRPAIVAELTPAWVRADAGLLRRAIANLLDNALRHARDVVRVSAGTDGCDVVVTVTDDGPGVAESDRERVFERFTRLDDARGRDAGGVGLGLAITRDAITTAGGTIRLEAADPGARFVIRLPGAPD